MYIPEVEVNREENTYRYLATLVAAPFLLILLLPESISACHNQVATRACAVIVCDAALKTH